MVSKPHTKESRPRKQRHFGGKTVISPRDTCWRLIGHTRSNSAVAHDRHHDIVEKVKPPFTKRARTERERRISQTFCEFFSTHLAAKICSSSSSVPLPRSSDSLSLLKLQPWWAPFYWFLLCWFLFLLFLDFVVCFFFLFAWFWSVMLVGVILGPAWCGSELCSCFDLDRLSFFVRFALDRFWLIWISFRIDFSIIGSTWKIVRFLGCGRD